DLPVRATVCCAIIGFRRPFRACLARPWRPQPATLAAAMRAYRRRTRHHARQTATPLRRVATSAIRRARVRHRHRRSTSPMTAEHRRLEEARTQNIPWKKWGPYLSERQWGTVREDYSESGDAWNHFSHDQARSRAYRWGEDGLAGFSDDQ